ncbi:helix-turn-helix domain-containing protein [Streptomyces heilongjiangensis]|uniref:XRE family transcriptional regulator n=1 Tax=Streptomyces heilongjiangensis TaxID=945052 RepID=A0ABW1BIY7_9ACTN|nr:XRE family transcriptional regulator [Streptomyces heilongjiangensis]MDC2950979.1 XRE family transcriptional regulator [Streptomyces heilongjiangensis]
MHRRSARERQPQLPHPRPTRPSPDPLPGPAPGPDPYGTPEHQAPTPPFDAAAARRLRAALGMGPEHVAYGMRSAYGLPYVTPDLVHAWERGTVAPTSPELTALAGVLWCSPSELIAAPRTLREHRMAQGTAPEDVARALGMDLNAYLHMEETGEWRGSERQATALAELLDLSLPELVVVTGRQARLTELLHDAVATRWQAYVRPTAKLLSLDRRLLEDVLQEMHLDYQGRTSASPTWANGTAATDAGAAGRDYLERITDHFWSLVRRAAAY